jgi:hypothetical protein
MGTLATMLETLTTRVTAILPGTAKFYIGISGWPIKRYLGKDVFPDYTLTGHNITFIMMQVLGYGDARHMGIMERALIYRHKPDTRCCNEGWGGERCGAPGTLGFIYLAWN